MATTTTTTMRAMSRPGMSARRRFGFTVSIVGNAATNAYRYAVHVSSSADSQPDSASASSTGGGILDGKIADVEAVDRDGVLTMIIGSALWAIAAIALIPFWGTLQYDGNAWWLWTAVAGIGIGLVGLEYSLWRRGRRTDPEAQVHRTVGGTPVTKPAVEDPRTHHHAAQKPVDEAVSAPDDTVIIRPVGGRRRSNMPESAPDDTVIIRQPGGRRRKE
jgi:hypothetical protein